MVKSKANKQRKNKRQSKGRLVQNNEFGDNLLVDSSKWLVNQPFYIKRFNDLTNVTQTAGADNIGVIDFNLSATDGYTDMTALFDEFMIDHVVVKFMPMYNAQPLAAPGTTLNCVLSTVLDYDDATTPTHAQMRQYATYKETYAGEIHTRSIAPKINTILLNTGGALTAQGGRRGWVDCAYADVPHFGLKFCLSGGAAAQTLLQTYSVEVEYFLKFRITR